MSYNFTFDLSKLSRPLFKEIAQFSEHEKINQKLAHIAKTLVQKFRVDELTGLSVKDSVTIIEDLISVQMKNCASQTQFQKTTKRALFLPHCCRKYMDNRCQAIFNTELSSYQCQHCSDDCMVHKATLLAQQHAYDIYVLPGGSGVRKIFKTTNYEGVVGIACTDELRMVLEITGKYNLLAQAIPLTKNGCANTQFDLETLTDIMQKK